MKQITIVIAILLLTVSSCDDRAKSIISKANDSVTFVGCWRSDTKDLVYNNRKIFEIYARDILNGKGVKYDDGDLQIVMSSMDLSKFNDMLALQIFENGNAKIYAEGGMRIVDGKWVKEGGSVFLLSNGNRVKLYNTSVGLQLDYMIQGELMRIDMKKDEGIGIVRMLLFKGRRCFNEGNALDSVKYFTQALEYKISKESLEYSDLINYLGYSYKKIGNMVKSIEYFEEYLTLHPNKESIYNKLAWVYSTSKITEIRNGKRGLEYAKKACELTRYSSPAYLDTLASAYAECNDFDSSIQYERMAIKLCEKPDDLKAYQERVKLFESGIPYRADD